MRSPIFWFGGKGQMAPKLLKLLPPHTHYVEPFGGGASLLFAKQPAGGVEVYNDLNRGLVDFFRVLRNPGRFRGFKRLVENTPYSRAEYDFCRATWRDCPHPVQRAYRWFVVARMSFAGRFGAGWGSAVSSVGRKRAQTTSRWQGVIDLLPEIHQRMMRVQIECADFRRIIQRYNAPGTLLYCDPPYVAARRKSGKYECELSDADHAELVELLLGYPAMVMLSGYRNGIYRPLEKAGWRRRDFQTACYAAGRTRATGLLGKGSASKHQKRVESVWRNPAAMDAAQ